MNVKTAWTAAEAAAVLNRIPTAFSVADGKRWDGANAVLTDIPGRPGEEWQMVGDPERTEGYVCGSVRTVVGWRVEAVRVSPGPQVGPYAVRIS